MIDDDPDNYHSTKNSAANFGFVLQYANNLGEGLEKIKKDRRILAVILDGKGFINPNQERGSDSQSFITKAISDLALLEREERRFIPKCVYTAWYDQLIGSLEGLIKVFDKKKLSLTNLGLKEMFDFLSSEINNTEEHRIRNSFQNVFDAVAKSNSPIENDAILFLALSIIDSEKVEKIHFNNLRDLLEIFLISLNRLDKKILPDELFKKPNEPNLFFCVRYLKGLSVINKELNIEIPKPVNHMVPNHIGYSVEFLKETTSSLSHPNSDYIKWKSYAYKSCVYTLCEIWLWYGLHIDKVTKKKGIN